MCLSNKMSATTNDDGETGLFFDSSGNVVEEDGDVVCDPDDITMDDDDDDEWTGACASAH